MRRPGDALELTDVGKRYGDAVIVQHVSLRLEAGEFVSLIGHSGCGKSTVLSMVAGLTPLSSGAITLGGRPVTRPGPDRGVVFQAPCLYPWMSVLDNVRLGLGDGKDARGRAERALRAVGLGDALAIKPASLSQGMRQRVAVARAFALEPRTLLLDEPFGMLDSLTRQDLQDLMLGLGDACPTTLLVTHDIDEALLLSDRIAVMTNGPAATIRAVLDVPFGHERTRAKVTGHGSYLPLRDRLLGLLEGAEGKLHAAA